jgi:cupin superfamily acireductone dioxygenase involved in methionine salvage
MKNGIAIIAFLLIAGAASAQQDSAGVVVHKDPRLDLLVKKQIEYNEVTTREARRFVQGYRILVVNTNDRNKASDAKTKMYQEFPELRTYLEWKAPFYKLKVGDFKTREEADEYLEDIKRVFPTGVYVVRDIIEVNPDKSAELQ